LILAITSLLIEKRNATIYCTRIIIDFAIQTQYILHDEQTLSYIENTLYIINSFKTIFVQFRLQNTIHNSKNENKSQFNISKFYVLIYYTEFICIYNSAQEFDSVYREVAYKYLLKQFFYRTNRNQE